MFHMLEISVPRKGLNLSDADGKSSEDHGKLTEIINTMVRTRPVHLFSDLARMMIRLLMNFSKNLTY